MKPIKQTLHDFWFDAAPATRLALLRILIGGYAFGYLLYEQNTWMEVARTDPRLFAPVGVVLHDPVGLGLFTWLARGTLVAGLCFTLGVCFRVTGPVFAGLLLWLLCYRNSWSMIYHSDNLVVMHVIVLGFTRAADALSLDTLFRDWRQKSAGGAAQSPVGWQYHWPVKLICALTVSAYFVTAVAKLTSELGMDWMTGQNLRAQMAMDGIRKELLGGSPNALAYAIYDWLPLFSVLSVGSLCIELFAPLALLNRRVGWLWAVAAFGLHWGILAVMHIRFAYQLSGVMFLSFFPLERALDWARKLWRRRIRGEKPARAPAGLSGAPQPSVSHVIRWKPQWCRAKCIRL